MSCMSESCTNCYSEITSDESEDTIDDNPEDATSSSDELELENTE